MASVALGDMRSAHAYSEEALALARELRKPRDTAAALIALAQLHRMESRPELAAPLCDEAVSISRESGDQVTIAIGLLNLAMVSMGQGNASTARSMLKEVLGIAQKSGVQALGQSALEVTCALSAHFKHWEQAALFFGAAEAQAERAGLRRDATDEAFLAPTVERIKLTLGAAAFESYVASGRALNYDEALSRARSYIEPADTGDGQASFMT
jgi:tetratricopeptide (TPR) repeat protein